jgi:hypothetical protein
MAMAGSTSASQPAGPAPPSSTGRQGRESGRAEPAQIDVEKLAERVYRLMLAEVRLERARRG